jgi:hypothetical protein
MPAHIIAHPLAGVRATPCGVSRTEDLRKYRRSEADMDGLDRAEIEARLICRVDEALGVVERGHLGVTAALEAVIIAAAISDTAAAVKRIACTEIPGHLAFSALHGATALRNCSRIVHLCHPKPFKDWRYHRDDVSGQELTP